MSSTLPSADARIGQDETSMWMRYLLLPRKQLRIDGEPHSIVSSEMTADAEMLSRKNDPTARRDQLMTGPE